MAIKEISEVITVGIIGAGRSGTPIIKELLKHNYVKIVSIVDLNPEAEGMKIGKARGIHTATNAQDLINLGEKVDLVFNLAGDPNLRRQLADAYQKSSNKHTIIVHETIARLIVTLVLKLDKLVPSFHPKIQGI